MVNVVFVAPFFMRATLQFVEGASRLPGVRLVLLSQDPVEKLPRELADRIAFHQRLQDACDADQIAAAVAQWRDRLGPIKRLLATLEQLQIPLGIVRDRLGIEGMGESTARNFREKSRMKDVLRQKGIACARHCLATSTHQAVTFAEQTGFPLVVKPPQGAGSRDTYKIGDIQELGNFLKRQEPSPGHPVLFEEFIMGNEHTFDSACINGKIVWHSIVRYFPTPLQVLSNPWIQWCVLLPREIDHPHFDDIRQTAAAGLKALGLQTGLSHMEWFRRTNGSLAISEVGARPPGGQITSMHGFAHDFDIHRAWANLMVNDRFDPPERRFAAGTVFLRGQGRGRVRAVTGIKQIREELGSLIVEAKLPQIGQPGSGTYEGDGYLMLRHPQTSVVEKALDRVISTLKIELA